ncbi:hypothetical protein A7K94_0222025, partial [Modestobacter sp. VKM Ac-2676]
MLDPALPLIPRVASAIAFSFIAGLVPSALFAGLASVSGGTDSAGAAIGLVTQGSAVGQLLGPPLVVAVGRLHPQKGYDVLLDAVARWVADPRLQPAPLVAIAGDGPL